MKRIARYVDKTPAHHEGQIISTSTLKMNKPSRIEGSHQLATASQTVSQGKKFSWAEALAGGLSVNSVLLLWVQVLGGSPLLQQGELDSSPAETSLVHEWALAPANLLPTIYEAEPCRAALHAIVQTQKYPRPIST
jgi:hypothetical protein